MSYEIVRTTNKRIEYPANAGDRRWFAIQRVKDGKASAWSSFTLGIMEEAPIAKIRSLVVEVDFVNLIYNCEWMANANAEYYQVKVVTIETGNTVIISPIITLNVIVPAENNEEIKEFSVRGVKVGGYGDWSDPVRCVMSHKPAWSDNNILSASRPILSAVKLEWRIPEVNFDKCIGYDIEADHEIHEITNPLDTMYVWEIDRSLNNFISFKIRVKGINGYLGDWSATHEEFIVYEKEEDNVLSAPEWPFNGWAKAYYTNNWRAKWLPANGTNIIYTAKLIISDSQWFIKEVYTNYASFDGSIANVDVNDYGNVRIEVVASNIKGSTEVLHGSAIHQFGWSTPPELSVGVIEDTSEFEISWPDPDLGGESFELHVVSDSGQDYELVIPSLLRLKKIKANHGETMTFSIRIYSNGVSSDWTPSVTKTMHLETQPYWSYSMTPTIEYSSTSRYLVVRWEAPDQNPNKVSKYQIRQSQASLAGFDVPRLNYTNNTTWIWESVPDYVQDTFSYDVRAVYSGGQTVWSNQAQVSITSATDAPEWQSEEIPQIAWLDSQWEIRYSLVELASKYEIRFGVDQRLSYGTLESSATSVNISRHHTRDSEVLFAKVRPVSEQGTAGSWSQIARGQR